MICPYCGNEAHLEEFLIIYGQSWGPVWMCEKYPDCDAWIACHPRTTLPLGALANKELREMRKKAHACFDFVWINKLMSRKEAYKELSKRLNLSEIHIGESDISVCIKIIEASSTMLHEWKD